MYDILLDNSLRKLGVCIHCGTKRRANKSAILSFDFSLVVFSLISVYMIMFFWVLIKQRKLPSLKPLKPPFTVNLLNIKPCLLIFHLVLSELVSREKP